LLDRALVVNERHLRRIMTTYLHHFNAARPPTERWRNSPLPKSKPSHHQ
jgi:hypothetical protein